MGLRFQDQPGGAPNDVIVHVDLLAAIRKLGLVSDLGPFHRLADYLAKRNVERTGIVLGLPLLRELFHESHYRDLGGGILEAFGRLFTHAVRLYDYTRPATRSTAGRSRPTRSRWRRT